MSGTIMIIMFKIDKFVTGWVISIWIGDYSIWSEMSTGFWECNNIYMIFIKCSRTKRWLFMLVWYMRSGRGDWWRAVMTRSSKNLVFGVLLFWYLCCNISGPRTLKVVELVDQNLLLIGDDWSQFKFFDILIVYYSLLTRL